MPERIQQSRARGWRKPPGAVSVARPSRWGNPWRVGDLLVNPKLVAEFPGPLTPADAVELYRRDLVHGHLPYGIGEVRARLRGRDLMCWCPLDQPCHADVLLASASGKDGDEL